MTLVVEMSFGRDTAPRIVFLDRDQVVETAFKLPARTTVGVTALAQGGIIEIDLTARRAAA